VLCVITSRRRQTSGSCPHGQAAIAYPPGGRPRHERHHRLDLIVSLPIPTREDKEIRDDRDDWLDLIGLSPTRSNGRKETRDDPHHRLDPMSSHPAPAIRKEAGT